jgi:hypothetical protein
MSGGGEHLVATPQHVLTHDVRRHVSIAGLGQIAVRGAANEATFALRIEPACGFSIRYHWSDWCAGSLLFAAASTSTATATVTATSSTGWILLPLPAASALVAGSTSIVSIALAGMTLLVSFA